tara:strand:- start:93 stop:323 length:231 start_codon:yes stop_codon:yes gene_type:complete
MDLQDTPSYLIVNPLQIKIEVPPFFLKIKNEFIIDNDVDKKFNNKMLQIKQISDNLNNIKRNINSAKIKKMKFCGY